MIRLLLTALALVLPACDIPWDAADPSSEWVGVAEWDGHTLSVRWWMLAWVLFFLVWRMRGRRE